MSTILYSNSCSESAKSLAKALGWEYINPWRERYHYKGGIEFRYGCGWFAEDNVPRNKRINTPYSTTVCVDKRTTLLKLKAAGVPVPDYVIGRKLSDDELVKWGCAVVRKTATGAKNEGLDFIYPGDEIPKAELYTSYFPHKREYRIVVFMGKVIGRYRKDEDDEGCWNLNWVDKKGFEAIDDACIRAANALGADFVGFDVLSYTKKKFVLLGANSGPVLNEEVKDYLVKYFKGK